MAIGAGHVCVFRAIPSYKTVLITSSMLSLSTGVLRPAIKMSRTNYDEIIAGDRPGPNKDKQKAKRLRNFTVPARLVQDSSATQTDRTIHVFCAFVNDSTAIVIADFARLVRMHVHSRSVMWTQDDMVVGGPVSCLL